MCNFALYYVQKITNLLITKLLIMKKVFTLALVLAMAMTSFAQVKSISKSSVKAEPAQMQISRGLESFEAMIPTSNRTIMTAPEEVELAHTTYDWQSNMAARNFTAVWPDGYAVMCYTIAGDASFSDRGTGLAIFDPAVGEWEYTEGRVEGVKTGFGSIARYKENGLVIAAHTSSDCRIFIVEDFRQGNRNFGEGIVLPTEGEEGRTQDICWPIVQCSGENLDIIHIMATEYSLTDPYPSALLYTRYENGAFTVKNHVIPNIDANHVSDGGSNIAYFMLYNPEKPNRVSFILNNAWSDGKLVISEDNGNTWTDRVYYQHPGINETYDSWYFYPRWTGAAFDAEDNLHIVYEYNGTTGEPGSGSYYPAIGGIAYWSELLPLNPMCVGGIPNGDGFIMDSTYIMQDLYESEWYWSDANHDPLPEYIGELEIVDNEGNVLPRESTEGNWPDNSTWGDHGSYNGGKAAFASMHMDGNMIVAFWSMIAGNESDQYWYSGTSQHLLRLFCNVSFDNGQTWEGTKQVLTDYINSEDEMVYGQVIPYVYNDAEGMYVMYCYMNDPYPGTFVQGDQTEYDNITYRAVKVYIDYMDVEENNIRFGEGVEVYPNPAKGAFNIVLNSTSDVNIYNTVGQLVKSFNNVKEMSVELEPGVYFVNANNQTKKVVVK
jgi:hypothetical protein